jgi:hypothetical protein
LYCPSRLLLWKEPVYALIPGLVLFLGKLEHLFIRLVKVTKISLFTFTQEKIITKRMTNWNVTEMSQEN